MRGVEFSKAIGNYLASKITRAYKSKAPQDAAFPYAVFYLPNSINTDPSEDFYLDVDVWDDDQDTTVLENLVDIIDGNGDPLNPTGLHHKTIRADNITATFYRESRSEIEDEDPRLSRRQLQYSVRVYHEGV